VGRKARLGLSPRVLRCVTASLRLAASVQRRGRAGAAVFVARTGYTGSGGMRLDTAAGSARRPGPLGNKTVLSSGVPPRALWRPATPCAWRPAHAASTAGTWTPPPPPWKGLAGLACSPGNDCCARSTLCIGRAASWMRPDKAGRGEPAAGWRSSFSRAGDRPPCFRLLLGLEPLVGEDHQPGTWFRRLAKPSPWPASSRGGPTLGTELQVGIRGQPQTGACGVSGLSIGGRRGPGALGLHSLETRRFSFLFPMRSHGAAICVVDAVDQTDSASRRGWTGPPDHGGLIFLDLRDSRGTIQILLWWWLCVGDPELATAYASDNENGVLRWWDGWQLRQKESLNERLATAAGGV